MILSERQKEKEREGESERTNELVILLRKPRKGVKVVSLATTFKTFIEWTLDCNRSKAVWTLYPESFCIYVILVVLLRFSVSTLFSLSNQVVITHPASTTYSNNNYNNNNKKKQKSRSGLNREPAYFSPTSTPWHVRHHNHHHHHHHKEQHCNHDRRHVFRLQFEP